MSQTCTQCSRLNPPQAAFCYHDGARLAGHRVAASADAQRFSQPFIFPGGQACTTFAELARTCQQNWPATQELLRAGFLENFLASQGRMDLAQAAREAARFPDADRGLDEFLARLPGAALDPPALQVEPIQINLGKMQPGQESGFDLHLTNQGMRLLYGTISCDDCPWLAVGGQ